MSNQIDFFQPPYNQLSIPCGRVSVYFDGVLCPCLEPLELVQSDWPEFGWARLLYNTAADDDEPVPAEEIETVVPIGKTVRIEQFYHFASPDVGLCSHVLFSGQVESIETDIGAKGERVEIIAKDFSVALKRICVYGRQIIDENGKIVFLPGFDTVFNEDGKPDASFEEVQIMGKTFTVFAAGPSGVKFWSYAEVINYLLANYLPDSRLIIPTLKQLNVLSGDKKVCNLDVTGLNLLDALHKCCEKINLQFKFVTVNIPSGYKQAIVFYKNGQSRTVELNFQQSGEQLNISKTDIVKLNSKKNCWPITHKYIGQGDFKIYEATFDLVKAWDPGLESTDYDKFSPSTNPDFYEVKDVYRKWCLNEAGDYSGSPYNQGQAFDFSKIFGYEEYSQHRRRFYSSLSCDELGKSMGYFLQVSFDSGQSWYQYHGLFSNLRDECGIRLSSDQLDIDIWSAVQDGTLKFRITAAVVSDQRLSCEVVDGPVDSTVDVTEHIAAFPRKFKYRKVACHSIFYGDEDYQAGPNEVDDTVILYESINNLAQTNSPIIESINIQTPYPALYYKPGDKVTSSPESRNLLGCKTDNRSLYWIKRLQTDFTKQCTNIKIIRQRKFM